MKKHRNPTKKNPSESVFWNPEIHPQIINDNNNHHHQQQQPSPTRTLLVSSWPEHHGESQSNDSSVMRSQ